MPTCPQISQVDSSCGGRSWDPDFKVAAAHVISPPLRSKEHQLALRRALAGGHLHLVGTDHCGWNSTQKAVGRHDFRCHSVLTVQHKVQKADAKTACLLHSLAGIVCAEHNLLGISIVRGIVPHIMAVDARASRTGGALTNACVQAYSQPVVSFSQCNQWSASANVISVHGFDRV